MKNETARREIESLDYYLQNHTNDYSEESHTAMMMAVKALEQQPCEDCVSREAVLDVINFEDEWLFDAKSHNADTKIAFSGLKSRVKDLPSVTSKPKTGHWIVIREKYEFMGGTVNEPRGCKCSNCNKVVRFKSDFCPNCGAKMAESEGNG